MATKLNIAKNARKKYREAENKYKKAVVENINEDRIAFYYDDKLEDAKEAIYRGSESLKNMSALLEKDSAKKGEYEYMKKNIEQMRKKIKDVEEKDT